MSLRFRTHVPVASLACLFVASAASGHTIWYVDAAGPCPGSGTQADPFCTIQAALDAASIMRQDEIRVADGVYTGTGNKDLDFNGKAIILRSESLNPANCIIDCQGSGQGFYFHTVETAQSVVQGFTIRNGYLATTTVYGGAVRCNGSSPTLMDCAITGNTAAGEDGQGGGVSCSGGNPKLINCTISGNTARRGGGLHCWAGSRPTLINCTITGNTASETGGGVYSFNSTPTLTDCTINGNTAVGTALSYGEGGGAYFSNYSSASLTRCTISGNEGHVGGGVACYGNVSVSLTHCTISGNTASGAISRGGGVHCSTNAIASLTDCMISGNTAPGGGGVYCSNNANSLLTNCTISRNTATGSGSGSGSGGGGVTCSYSSPTLTNCTISGNTASSLYGGALRCINSSSQPTLTNCILWGDSSPEFYVDSGTPVVTYCDVQGGYPGTGNINLNPLFIDPDGPDNDPSTWADNNYRLTVGSPCIDTGFNAAVPTGITTDIEGRPRIYDGNHDGAGVVDRGAYEYTLPGDFNYDGALDTTDYWYIHDGLGTCSPQQAYADHIHADMDHDGCITLVDYRMWLLSYRAIYGTDFVPPGNRTPIPLPASKVADGISPGTVHDLGDD